MKRANTTFRKSISLSMTLLLLCVSSSVFALNASNSVSQKNDERLQSVIQPLMYAQSDSRSSTQSGSSYRSKSEVMQQVKNQYNGKVIRISLNERSATYSVRVLLPSGKVKSLSGNARK